MEEQHKDNTCVECGTWIPGPATVATYVEQGLIELFGDAQGLVPDEVRLASSREKLAVAEQKMRTTLDWLRGWCLMCASEQDRQEQAAERRA